MNPRIDITPQASDELHALAAYLARSSARTSERFLSAVEQTLQTLVGMPEMGSPFPVSNPRLEGLRCWPVRRFRNYLIFYLVVADGIQVLHFLYGTRNIEAILEDSSSA